MGTKLPFMRCSGKYSGYQIPILLIAEACGHALRTEVKYEKKEHIAVDEVPEKALDVTEGPYQLYEFLFDE